MTAAAWVAALLFAAAAIADVAWRRIDDGVVVALLCSWAAGAVAVAMPWSAVWGHLAAATASFLVGWGCFAVGWLGGGDVKLAAAVFLWAGPGNGVAILAIVAGTGIVVALFCLLAKGLTRLPLPRPVATLAATLSSDRGVPYGVALSTGGTLAALASQAYGV